MLFVDSDELVRTHKVAKKNRSHADLVGVVLPPRWKLIVNELYAGHPATERHRFDIIFAIINQTPPALMKLQSGISRWYSGMGGASKTGAYCRYVVGDRQFVVMLNFMRKKQLGEAQDVTNFCRAMAYQAAEGFNGTTDCVVLSYAPNSKNLTYDGVAFFRVKNGDPLGFGAVI